MSIIELDHQIIPELPYTWRDALRQGDTGIIATPSESQVENIIQLAKDFIPVHKLCSPLTVSSWLRTKIHNAQVGGSITSSHLLGAALDFVPLSKTVEECKSLIKQITPRILFLELNTTTWVHIDYIHNHDFIA